jgi:hypothetical protein
MRNDGEVEVISKKSSKKSGVSGSESKGASFASYSSSKKE